MKRLPLWILASLLVLAVLPAVSLAGIVMEVATRGPGDTKKETMSTMHAEADRLSVRNGGMWGIFRSDKQVMWLVQEKEGKYTEITEGDMKELEQQMSGAMAEMEKQLAAMPPEQRAMAEKMMAGKMPADSGAKPDSAPAPITYKATGKTEKINGHLCKSYNIMQGEKKVSEAWLADWKEFGLRLEEFKVFGEFAAFASRLAGPVARQLGTGVEKSFTEYVPGLPVRTITTTAKGPVVTEIKRVTHEEIAEAEFEPPAGLKKETIADMAGTAKEKDK